MPKLVLEDSSPTRASNFKSSSRERQGREGAEGAEELKSTAAFHLPVNDTLALQEEQTDGNFCSVKSEMKRKKKKKAMEKFKDTICLASLRIQYIIELGRGHECPTVDGQPHSSSSQV